MKSDDERIRLAAEALADADALLIGAGAGMGVDSGLPDFRGNEGFWKAYPPLETLGISFVEMANPAWFEQEPELAWGFYGHRLGLYRRTQPHDGFKVLHRWAQKKRHGAFVFTSNVDGQFQKAGFSDDYIVECHGSIHHLQCTTPCSNDIWNAKDTRVDVDEASFRATPELPRCQHCGCLARPNILMFGDSGWISERTSRQERRLVSWLEDVRGARLLVVELGAGTAVPTVRWHCQSAAAQPRATHVRINLREAHGPARTIALSLGAREALRAIDAAVNHIEP